MSNETIKTILEKVAYHGAGTINSLIYGDRGDSIQEFLNRRNEGGTSTRRYRAYTADGREVERVTSIRNDADLCREINNLVNLGILCKFAENLNDPDNYRTAIFYKIDSNYASKFNANPVPRGELESYVSNNCLRSGNKGRSIRVNGDSYDICLSNLARNHLDYGFTSLKDLIESGYTSDPGILERTKKHGNSLSDIITSEAKDYFISKNILELNSESRKKLFLGFINDQDGTMKRFREYKARENLIASMDYHGITNYFKEHRDSLIEFVKRNTELDKMTSVG